MEATEQENQFTLVDMGNLYLPFSDKTRVHKLVL